MKDGSNFEGLSFFLSDNAYVPSSGWWSLKAIFDPMLDSLLKKVGSFVYLSLSQSHFKTASDVSYVIMNSC